VVEIYPHTELDGNRKNCGRDVRTDSWTDTLDFSKSVRSLPGNDLKLKYLISYVVKVDTEHLACLCHFAPLICLQLMTLINLLLITLVVQVEHLVLCVSLRVDLYMKLHLA